MVTSALWKRTRQKPRRNGGAAPATPEQMSAVRWEKRLRQLVCIFLVSRLFAGCRCCGSVVACLSPCLSLVALFVVGSSNILLLPPGTSSTKWPPPSAIICRQQQSLLARSLEFVTPWSSECVRTCVRRSFQEQRRPAAITVAITIRRCLLACFASKPKARQADETLPASSCKASVQHRCIHPPSKL